MFSSASSTLAESPADNILGLWPIIGYIVSAIIGIIVGTILNPLIDPLVSKLWSKINPLVFRRTKKLSGTWEHTWHVESTRFNRENPATEVKLKQFRNKVSATYKVKDKNNTVYTYAMEGKIDSDNYLSGEWYDVYAGNTYHGTFLLYIDVNMNSMEGTWIGKSQDNNVKSGKWEWKRA